MVNLLCASALSAIFPAIVMFVVFVVFVGVFASAAKKRQAEESKQAHQRQQRPKEFTDGNGRTQHQRDYLNGLRAKQAERKIAAQNNAPQTGSSVNFESQDHSHVSDDEEYYEEIVGSLGDVSDEGCDDLSGVRLIVHDLAYEGEDSQRDYSEVAKVVVLGDIINSPRFKSNYRKK